MEKIIKCQAMLRKRIYDEVIVGSIFISSKLLEPKKKYKITVTSYDEVFDEEDENSDIKTIEN